MSRVEPIERSNPRDDQREAGRGRSSEERISREEPGPGATPGTAEGDERDVDQALRQKD